MSHIAQPMTAMAGSAARRASDVPNDHPANLIAVPHPAAGGSRPHMKKAPQALPVRLHHHCHCTDPAVGRQSPGVKMVHTPRQYCGGGTSRMELPMRGGYI